jgi:YVTN family beta-propeller protein
VKEILPVGVCLLAVATVHAQIGAQPGEALLNAHATASSASTHQLYAVESAQNSVAIFDTRTGSRREVAVGKEPIAIAINPVDGAAYVVNAGDATVSILDASNDAVTATVHVTHPYDIAVDPQTGNAMVANTFSDKVEIIDAATRTVRSRKAGSADAIVADVKLGRVYLLGYEDSEIRIWSGGSIARQPATMHLWGAATNVSDGTLWVTALGNGQVIAVDGNSGEQSTIAVGALPCAIAVNSKTGNVYVADCADDTLTMIDGRTRKVVNTASTGQHPQAVTIDDLSGTVYVANTHGGSVMVIDGITGRTRATVPCGPNPYSLAALGGTVIVAHVNGPATVIDMRKPSRLTDEAAGPKVALAPQAREREYTLR